MYAALSRPRCAAYTFRSALGLLSATQFTQPALTVMEAARFADLAARGAVPAGRVRFAGHSLGEYGALAALGGGLMPVEKLAAITFVRGLTMQMAVARDPASGRSDFSMCAVNPAKVGARAFDEAALEAVVAAVTAQSPGWLLEVVNYNVRGAQYICAGHTRALACLTAVLGRLGKAGGAAVSVSDETTLRDVVRAEVDAALAMEAPWDYERSAATVPLRLIDVPFHSSFLASGVETYRRFLRGTLRREDVATEALVGRWIPNVTGRAFGVSKAHFEDMYGVTGSERLREILDEWAAPAMVETGV
jgi:fatty acid synthase subunit beta, fungi type